MEIDRKAICPCGSGRRYRVCCWPADRARAAITDSARVAFDRVDAVNRNVLPLVAAQGHVLACKPGCNACCKSLIRATRAEATLIAQWLLEPDQAELRARFEAALPAWRAQLGDELATLEVVLRHGTVPASGADHGRFVEALRVYQARGVLCPFNDSDGRCAIYPVRPLPCRSINVVGTAEFCQPGGAHGPSVVRHADLAAAITTGRRAMAEATRDRSERALPEAVAAALSRA